MRRLVLIAGGAHALPPRSLAGEHRRGRFAGRTNPPRTRRTRSHRCLIDLHGVRLAAGPAILRERAVSALMLALPGHLRPSSDCGIWHHAASTRLVPVLVAGLGVRALRWTEGPQECSYMMAFAVAARLGLAINGACQCPAIT